MKRYLDCYIPTENCNLRCHYCYIAQKREFNSKLAHFPHDAEYIRRALSQKRMGGACLVNLCAGGETLLAKDVLPVAKALLGEGHYVMLVTNGTITQRFEEITGWSPDLLRRLFFKFSFHYLEFKRLDLLNVFFSNVKRMQKAGCSFTVEITPSDELIPYIDEVIACSQKELGALPHVTIARDDRTDGIEALTALSWEEYQKIWGVFQSELFDFKTEIFSQIAIASCNISSRDVRW